MRNHSVFLKSLPAPSSLHGAEDDLAALNDLQLLPHLGQLLRVPLAHVFGPLGIVRGTWPLRQRRNLALQLAPPIGQPL